MLKVWTISLSHLKKKLLNNVKVILKIFLEILIIILVLQR